MLLYLVYDTQEKTVSTPLLAPTQEIAQDALNQLNPENLSNLIIHPLAILNSPLDLFLLSLDENLNLPNYLIGAAIPEELQANTDEVCATQSL